MRERLNTVVNIGILVTLAVLLLEPNGVLGSRIMAWKGQRDVHTRVAEAWPDLVRDGSVIGSPSPEARTVVEFVDYECPSCRSIARDLTRMAQAADVRVVIRHYPLPIHVNADAAARAAICAGRQGVFAKMHEALLQNEELPVNPDWRAIAVTADVPDPDMLLQCMSSAEAKRALESDLVLARMIGVRGTPTFVSLEGMLLGADVLPELFLGD